MDKESALTMEFLQKPDKTQVLLIDFVCVFFLSLLWNLSYGLTWQPLLLLILPVYLHLIYRYPVVRLEFRNILPVLIVFAAAIISATISYNQQGAIEKLFVVIGACLLFVAVAIQPFENISKIIVITGVLGGLWTILFILTQQWDLRVVDINFVNGIIEKWEDIRPAGLDTFIQNEDILGGVLAIFAPLLVSVLILRRKYARFFGSIITPVCQGIVLFGIFISGSRPAWAGILVSTMFYVFLFLAFFANQRVRKWAAILSSFILVLLLIVVGLSNFQESSAFLGRTISNIPSLKERQFLYQQMGFLVQDFFFTGGGLAAFPGVIL